VNGPENLAPASPSALACWMRAVRRTVTLLTLAAALAAPGAARGSDVIVLRDDGRTVVRDDPALPPADDPGCAPAPEIHAAAAGTSRTVLGTLRRVRRAGAITRSEHDRYERSYRHARVVRDRLGGTRKRELAAVITTMQRLAGRRMLTSGRLPVLFHQLDANVRYWQRGRFPRVAQGSSRPCAGGAGQGGARVMFDGDETVFQWYSGQGLQVQQLATFGRANALATACLPEIGPSSIECDRDRVRTAMDGIVRLAAERSGFVAWEYYFAFGGGRPPWISGLAQATAMQALTRGTKILGDPRYLELAGRGVGAFRRSPPVGVRVRAGRGPHFLIYSYAPRLRVFNAFLQALIGLYDYAEASGDRRARELFEAGERQARVEVPRADTGAWSRYSLGGAESDLGYHRLVRDFLRRLCDRTRTRVYCATADRFTRYLREPPRLRVLAAGGRTVRIRLSKISCVTLRAVRGRRVVARVVRVLGGGRRTIGWRAPRSGRYTLRVEAKDLTGRVTRVRRSVRVR
jgi:D-glucuronyl C5-epimerase C-terminus